MGEKCRGFGDTIDSSKVHILLYYFCAKSVHVALIENEGCCEGFTGMWWTAVVAEFQNRTPAGFLHHAKLDPLFCIHEISKT